MKHHVFVYGTLKRGGNNHRLLAGQRFLGLARTRADYRLFELNGYPGLVKTAPGQGLPIEGEVWAVDPHCLQQLDRLEGLDEGLYAREPVPLDPPYDTLPVEGYVYLQSVVGRRECGANWPV